MTTKEDLKFVYETLKEMSVLNGCEALVAWDQEVYMPEGGGASRAEQLALLTMLTHKRITQQKLYTVVKRLHAKKLSKRDARVIKKLYRRITLARKLPHAFVEEMARTTSLAKQAWFKAKKQKKFALFKPHLEKLVKLKRKEAKYLNLPGHKYNSLLDQFEEGMTVERLKPFFEELKATLVPLLKKIRQSKRYKQRTAPLKKQLSREQVEWFVNDVTHRMGVLPPVSRWDASEHPFTTTIGLGDVRFTTHFKKDPFFAMFSTAHEAGHALYELQMPAKEHYTNVGDAPSYGLHESQSRLWENIVARSEAFWKFYLPKLAKGKKQDFNEWYCEVNRIEPCLVRIEADEVQYSLHVLLRFEIECALFEGTLQVKDVPKVWKQKSKEYLGVTPKDDSQGALQDVHWSGGYFGYFPSYVLGNVYASQLWDVLLKKHPKVEKEMAKGNFKTITTWLRKNVHEKGSFDLAEDVVKNVCGKGLDTRSYLKYLTEKYSKVYDL